MASWGRVVGKPSCTAESLAGTLKNVQKQKKTPSRGTHVINMSFSLKVKKRWVCDLYLRACITCVLWSHTSQLVLKDSSIAEHRFVPRSCAPVSSQSREGRKPGRKVQEDKSLRRRHTSPAGVPGASKSLMFLCHRWCAGIWEGTARPVRARERTPSRLQTSRSSECPGNTANTALSEHTGQYIPAERDTWLGFRHTKEERTCYRCRNTRETCAEL